MECFLMEWCKNRSFHLSHKFQQHNQTNNKENVFLISSFRMWKICKHFYVYCLSFRSHLKLYYILSFTFHVPKWNGQLCNILSRLNLVQKHLQNCSLRLAVFSGRNETKTMYFMSKSLYSYSDELHALT